MSDDTIERVARAIWALNEDTDCNDYDQLTPRAKSRADGLARAAIEAMREPTPDDIFRFLEARKDWAIGHFSLTDWQAMIDAMLSTK